MCLRLRALSFLSMPRTLTCLLLAVDFVSMQSLLFNGAVRGWWGQTYRLVKLQSRLTED